MQKPRVVNRIVNAICSKMPKTELTKAEINRLLLEKPGKLNDDLPAQSDEERGRCELEGIRGELISRIRNNLISRKVRLLINVLYSSYRFCCSCVSLL